MLPEIKKKEKGKAKSIPSIRSKIPPCPGIIFPVFLIFETLLKYEIVISPHWLTVETEIEKQIVSKENWYEFRGDIYTEK